MLDLRLELDPGAAPFAASWVRQGAYPVLGARVAVFKLLEQRPLPAGLEPRQLKAIELLLQGKDMKATATACGVTLPVMFEWRYSLPFAEEMAKRISDLQAITHAQCVAHAPKVLGRILAIAEDPEHKDQLKAATWIMDRAKELPNVYTTQAEWNAAREHARKSAYAELWRLPDSEIVATVRELKSLPPPKDPT